MLLGLLIVPAGLLVGCGDNTATGGAPSPPHGGIMAAVPGGKGYAELIVGPAAGAKKGQQVKSQITAYFYQSDGATEMSPAPTDVKIKVGTAAGSPTFALTPQPKEQGKFASEPADIPEGFRGQLEATINGAPVQLPYAIR
jgi:hypothetical protein